MRLTDLAIRSLKAPESGQRTYTDDALPGFGVRVSQGGTRTFVLVMGANRQRVKIGDVGVVKLADARTKAKTLLAEKQLGIHQTAGSPTFQKALEDFLEASAQRCRPRTVRDYKRLLTRHGFGLEKLDDISPRDIQKKLDKLKATPSERTHVQAALQIFFRFCLRRHFLDRNPTERMERLTPQKSRTRVLSDDELKKIWNACEGMFGAIVRLCMLLGQRRSELAHVRWEWVQDDMLVLPAEVTKNKREHRIPIGPMARAIINEQPQRKDNPYVFPARKDWSRKKRATVYNAWGKDKPALDHRSGVTGWVIHDLRRTLVSSWAGMGVRIEVCEKYIGHVSGSFAGIVGVYQRHSFMDEMRAASLAWEAHLATILKS